MKKIISLLLALAMVLVFAGCGAKEPTKTPDADKTVKANVFMISGPTGIGAVNLMSADEAGTAKGDYEFTVVANPTEIVAKISNKEADIAAVATNMASTIYNKTNGGVTVLAVNTLGVLNVLTNGTEINTLADLKGKKVYTTGQGANPEYVIDYLLEKNGVNPDTDVDLQFKAEGTELVSVWATDPTAVIIAPQPVASSVLAKYKGSKLAIDLTDEWDKVGENSALMMGCVIVRNEFLNANKATVDLFLEEYEASIKKATEDLDGTAALCEKYGIVAKAAVAKKAIPASNICFVTGNEMKTKLSGYLAVLFAADKKAVGGKLPADDFYYEK
ncbi:MAG: ABC transporter substrate-binding protein [Ruminococcaceae bacterium]|nr:ABC transporter substrate-binding protein [Oscillospiraceae bacterium]